MIPSRGAQIALRASPTYRPHFLPLLRGSRHVRIPSVVQLQTQRLTIPALYHFPHRYTRPHTMGASKPSIDTLHLTPRPFATLHPLKIHQLNSSDC